MSNLYLILHKVRGQPAFDIAELVPLFKGEPPVYLIPTSGHGAYPIRSWKLDDLVDSSVGPEHECPYDYIAYDAIPQSELDSVQDHYHIVDVQKPVKEGIKMAAEGLLRKIGLAVESKPMQRRRL